MSSNKLIKALKRTILIILSVTCFILSALLSYVFIQKKFLYPIKFQEEILKYSTTYLIDPYLILSVIKTESGFKIDAISPAGAKGLMQLTDSTASYVAKLLKKDSFEIFDADLNINFGTFYIRYLIDKFTNLEVAIAAFNAGEGNVSYWLKNPSYSDDGKTLKHIPFPETREYVKKIFNSLTKYKKLYGNFLTNQLILSKI